VIGLKIVKPELEFVEGLLKKHNPESILVTHSRVQFSTIFDAHMDGIIAGKDGCQCHYFVDRIGDVYEGKSEGFASDLAENAIVILLEGNLEGHMLTDLQQESLFKLAKKLKEQFKLKGNLNSKELSGHYFPLDEFSAQFDSVTVKEEVVVEEQTPEQEEPKEEVKTSNTKRTKKKKN
jgi:hypothetical protein